MEQKQLFYKLIDILERHSIKYAITGRTEGYPDNIGSDVDIVVPKSEIDKFHQAIWGFDADDTKVVQMFQHECVAFYYIVFSISEEGVYRIQPDVCTDYYRKGRLLLKADYLLDGIKESEQGGFNVLSPEKEFIYYLLKKIDKQNISDEQFLHILHNYQKSPHAAMEEASKFWNGRELALIQEAFEKEAPTIISNNIRLLQNGIHSSHRRGMADSVRNLLLKCKRILHPTGLVIGVLGPDGSGKTTIMNQVKQDMRKAFRRKAEYHLYPLPQKSSTPDTNPQGKTKRGLAASILKLCYFVLVYNYGWFRYVIPYKIRSTFVIFDRYYEDILVDPLRYRNGTPAWVVKLFGALIPKPDLWIVLDAPTEVIQARKAEVRAEETERQRKEYHKLAEGKKNSILVDTNRDVRVISIDICKFLCSYLHQRAIKRYKR